MHGLARFIPRLVRLLQLSQFRLRKSRHEEILHFPRGNPVFVAQVGTREEKL